MLEDKISIIMPVYNTEKYVERAVESILNQSYKNLEIICVDDGSTDSSGNILDRIAQKDSRLIVIHSENRGVSNARNIALEIASGDYIGFVDSDDYIAESMYEVLLKEASRVHADMVTCGYYFDREGVITKALNKKKIEDVVYAYKDFLRYVYERDMYNAVAGYLWTKLIRRNVLFDENSKLLLKFDDKYGGADDIVFVAETMRRSKAIYYVNQAFYYYYERNNSIVHDEKRQLATLHWLESYRYILELYQEDNIDIEIYNIICRMYIYRCAKTLELAIKYNDVDKINKIKPLILEKLDIYIKENQSFPDRVKWIEKLLNT